MCICVLVERNNGAHIAQPFATSEGREKYLIQHWFVEFWFVVRVVLTNNVWVGISCMQVNRQCREQHSIAYLLMTMNLFRRYPINSEIAWTCNPKLPHIGLSPYLLVWVRIHWFESVFIGLSPYLHLILFTSYLTHTHTHIHSENCAFSRFGPWSFKGEWMSEYLYSLILLQLTSQGATAVLQGVLLLLHLL